MLLRIRTPIGPNGEHDFSQVIPTGTLVEDSIFGWSVVDVPDETIPLGFVHSDEAVDIPSARGPVRVGASRADTERLYAHFDRTYQEHAGRFRPEFV